MVNSLSVSSNAVAVSDGEDARDPLAHLRSQFLFPDQHPLYFAGHSLGLQPRRAREYVLEALDEWASLGVEGHFAARTPWTRYHELLAAPTAALAGALTSEVVVMNTLTVNLHLLMASFYRPTAERHRILIETGAFPSDQYAVDSQARLHGYPYAVLRSDDPVADLEEHGDTIALVLLGQPNYLTGRAFDVPAVVRAGHARGCVVGLDLAHGIGNLALKLHDWDVDFAAWCTYKYLNGGPGNLGGVFIHERHFDAPRLEGWWGTDPATRFQMSPDFKRARGADAWQLSNPPLLELAALRASLELFPPMEEVRKKGDRLTAYLESLLRELPFAEVLTPPERGSMLTVRFKGGDTERLVEALKARGALVDLRPPDIVRIAPAPLYNSFADVQQLCALLRELHG